MKRFFVSIEDIHIVGSPEYLSMLVVKIDRVMQSISQATEMVCQSVLQYGVYNEGPAFEKCVDTLVQLRDTVYEASEELNDMQTEILRYQEKIQRFEDQIVSTPTPNRFHVNRLNMSLEARDSKYNISELRSMLNELEDYSKAVCEYSNELVKLKNDIGDFWKDSQYDVFANYVDEIELRIKRALQVFGEFVNVFERRLKEFE